MHGPEHAAPLPAASERLGSWTRTLNEDDAITVVLDAQPGQRLADWEARAHDVLPQANRARRVETIRLVRDQLLDLHADRIAPSTWLRLFQEGSPARRLGLLYGRLHARRPWILRAADELILPHLARADEPLAPHDADLIAPDEWTDFVARHRLERTRPESVKKTRTVIQRNLARLGVLEITAEGARGARDDDDDAAPEALITARHTRTCHGEPDPVAFGWVLWHELTTLGRSEAPETWALSDAVAARIFAPRRPYAQRCVEAAIDAGEGEEVQGDEGMKQRGEELPG